MMKKKKVKKFKNKKVGFCKLHNYFKNKIKDKRENNKILFFSIME